MKSVRITKITDKLYKTRAGYFTQAFVDRICMPDLTYKNKPLSSTLSQQEKLDKLITIIECADTIVNDQTKTTDHEEALKILGEASDLYNEIKGTSFTKFANFANYAKCTTRKSVSRHS